MGCTLTWNLNSVFQLHIFSTSIFHIRAEFSPFLEKNRANFSPQSPNLPFQFGADGEALEILENTQLLTLYLID